MFKNVDIVPNMTALRAIVSLSITTRDKSAESIQKEPEWAPTLCLR
jgi:hypothetical protein